MSTLSRRLFLALTPTFGLAFLPRSSALQSAPASLPMPAASRDGVDDPFPTQSPVLVKEMVGVSHRNLDRVRELVERQPSLARATWDWGFGDWESALDAASHVGNREIAEFLISHGARPTIFTAAMLGQLEAVRALVAALPGIQRGTGPHGLTLLHHAKAGGAPATEVTRYLESLGDADPRPALVELNDAETAMLVGTYAFGNGPRDRVEIALDRAQLSFERPGGTRLRLFHLGSYAFFPSGAPAVRIRFEVVEGRSTALAVHDPDLVLTARRANT